MPDGWLPGPAPAAAPAVGPDAGGWTPGPAPPSFSSSNERDAQGQPIARDDPGLWAKLNTPMLPQIARAAHELETHLSQPHMADQRLNDVFPGLGTLSASLRGATAGAIGGAGDVAASFTTPIGVALTLLGLGESSAAVKLVPALKAAQDLPAVRALVRIGQGAAGAGFAVHGAGDVAEGLYQGDYGQAGRGVAETAGGLAGVMAAAAPRLPPGPTPARGPLTPQELRSNAFAEREGIPLDAATATGSRWARAAEKRVANSMGGEGTASDLIQRQHAGLTAAGERLAGSLDPAPATPDSAGRAVQQSIRSAMADLHLKARAQYGELERLEQDPAYAADVPRQSGMTASDRKQMEARQMGSLGFPPTSQEITALRGIQEELDNLRFVKRTWNDISKDVGKKGNAAGGDAEIVPGAAGASVYDDIVAHMRDTTYTPTRSDIGRQIGNAIDTGHFTSAAKAAVEVAQKRLSGDRSVGRPELPPDAGALSARTESMGMPVHLAPVKEAMRPIYDSLKAKAAVTPLFGSEAGALQSLERLINGPDYVPVSVANGVASDLGKASRVAVPELRGRGEGIAAKALGELKGSIDEIVSQVPGASEALSAGRAATKAKYEAGDVLKQVAKKNDGGVDVFQRLTAPKDTEIDLLRNVQQITPDSVPKIARAKMEAWMDQATVNGRFEHADKLSAEWNKLGAQTKDVLFGDKVPALDDFFRLAKRLNENPNPSGTAHTASVFNVLSQIGTYPAAKMLYSQTGVKMLTNLARADLRVASGTAKAAATQAAWANLALAAKAEGVTIPAYPRAAAARDEEQRPK